MTAPHDRFDDRFDEQTGIDPQLREVVARLEARGRRLRVRSGLADRIFAAVERELDAPAVVARVGPSPIRRWAALAAILTIVLAGLTTALLLRGGLTGREDPVRAETLVLAEASPAERLLVAFVDESVPGAASDRREFMEEILPGSTVRYDELDLELRRILESVDADGSATR
ncbi:MAG: deoxyribodipyrimidine photo-lyase [Phycisphaerae bacterium]|nr:deoxyribodipyrimidine photo-lyase [Phycisphaerae bacterium]